MPKPPAPKNKAPSSITLSNSSINENAPGADIGVLTVRDPDKGDTATFTVSDDRFIVVTDAQGRSRFDFKPVTALIMRASRRCQSRLTATDSGGLSKTQSFTIAVSDLNEAPSYLALSNADVAENAAGAGIGTLSASDPENDTLYFSVAGPEATRFETIQDPTTGQWALALKSGVSLDYEQETSVDVTVRASDGLLSHDEVLTIAVVDQPDGSPVRVSLVSDEAQGGGGSYVRGGSTVSEDGRYVAYYSDVNGLEVYVYDRQTGMTERERAMEVIVHRFPQMVAMWHMQARLPWSREIQTESTTSMSMIGRPAQPNAYRSPATARN